MRSPASILAALLVVGAASSDPALGAVTGRLALESYSVVLVGSAPANGDDDGYADTDETIDLAVRLINKTGAIQRSVVLTLSSGDPTIECVSTWQVVVPEMPAGAAVTAPPFRFKVGGASAANRTSIDDLLQATFTLTARSAQFDELERPISFRLNLDLSSGSAGGTSAWIEDFESGGSGFGKFTLQTLDAGKNSLAASNGMRCQYNDPDAPNSFSRNNDKCFLGFGTDPPAGVNDWHVHDVQGGVGRAFTGTRSLHWGVHPFGTPVRDTTRLKQLDAVKSTIAINLPRSGSAPELAFAHQVSLADHRLQGPSGQALDRAIVEVNVLKANGQESPTWTKIAPYWNEYDSQGTFQYVNCAFDPTDDGNDEDSYFDPSDPNRLQGPSSTCMPERVFADGGSTDYRFPASPAGIGDAFDGPGLAGSIDVGTWVRPRFNLQEFAGRRIKLRLLATSLEVGDSATWDNVHGRDNFAGDDGWYIDDVRVDRALGAPLALSADTAPVIAIPCPVCTSIAASLTATPSAIPGPGGVVTLDARGSTADVCNDGPLKYQFWIDGNANGVVGDPADTLLLDFTESPSLVVTPDDSARYAVLVRCPSAPSCDALDGSDTATASVTVDCPSGVARFPFPQAIRVDKLGGLGLSYDEPDPVATIGWPTATSVDVVQGRLSGAVAPPATATLRGGGGFTGTLTACLASDSPPIASLVEGHDPGADSGFYYLVRGQPSATCAPQGPGFTTNDPAERAGRDPEIDADALAASCP